MILRTGNNRQLQKRQGFTLIEVLLTVVIISVGLATIIRAYVVSLDAVTAAQGYIDSLSVAKEKMAEILLAENEKSDILKGPSQGIVPGKDFDFSWETQMTALDNQGFNTLTVKVSNVTNDFSRGVALVSYVQIPE